MSRARAFPRLALVAATLTFTGCMLASGQLTVVYDTFPDPMHLTELLSVIPVPVDLNTISSYHDHKDAVKGLYDVAVLGRFAAAAGSGPVQVELWMTPATTTHLTASAVMADPTALKLWGTALAAGETHSLTWSESTKEFSAAGRAALLTEARGDGQFTVYALATGPATYDATITHPSIIFTVDAGY